MHLKNGTYEQIVSHLERELEVIELEGPVELPIKTVMQQDTQRNNETQKKTEPTCHHHKKPSHYQNECSQLKREKYQAKNNTISANNNSNNINGGQTLAPTLGFPRKRPQTIQ